MFEEKFEDTDWASRGWYDNPDMVIDTSNRVGDSGGSAEFKWTESGKTVAESRGARVLFDPVEGLTISFYVKFNSNWEWTGRGWHPHFILFITNVDDAYIGPRRTHLTLYIEPVDGRLVFGMQDGLNIDLDHLGENLVGVTENRAVAGGNGDPDGYGGSHYVGDGNVQNSRQIVSDSLFFTDEQGPHYKGDWHQIKAHIQLNSIIDGKGVANGVLRYWYDGKLIMDYHDIMMRTGQHPQMKINQFLLLPYFGPGVPHQQSIWIDELKIIKQEQELPLTQPGGCDINGNGRINIADVIAMLLLGRRNPDDPRLDWNSDGAYGITDVIALLMDIVKGNCPE
ncbi:MAG: hypothetical protein U9P14_00475 [Gemmatimonadota bacterium]|nr:hypothetical protein [Gemmatimonadota bacterium]